MSHRQNRFYRREKTRLIIKWLIIALFIISVIFIVKQIYHRTMESLARHNREIIETRMGYIEKTSQAEAIILNDEKTYYAPCEGYFENTVKEGERVRVGSQAGYFIPANGERIVVQVPDTGIFTRKTDGLEGLFENPALIKPGAEIFEYKIKDNSRKEYYYKNDPVFKMVNNMKPADMLVRLSGQPTVGIRPNDKVTLRYKNNDLGEALINSVQYANNSCYLYLKCQEYQEFLINQRKIKLTVVFDRKEGIVIPASALQSKNGEKGVFCIKGEDTYFQPVKVMTRQNDKILVEGLATNEMVVTNP